jgi:hypothetical protein
MSTLTQLENHDEFIGRHIGPDAAEQAEMLGLAEAALVSFANEAALAWGVRPGQSLQSQLANRVMHAAPGLPDTP